MSALRACEVVRDANARLSSVRELRQRLEGVIVELREEGVKVSLEKAQSSAKGDVAPETVMVPRGEMAAQVERIQTAQANAPWERLR